MGGAPAGGGDGAEPLHANASHRRFNSIRSQPTTETPGAHNRTRWRAHIHRARAKRKTTVPCTMLHPHRVTRGPLTLTGAPCPSGEPPPQSQRPLREPTDHMPTPLRAHTRTWLPYLACRRAVLQLLCCPPVDAATFRVAALRVGIRTRTHTHARTHTRTRAHTHAHAHSTARKRPVRWPDALSSRSRALAHPHAPSRALSTWRGSPAHRASACPHWSRPARTPR